MAWTTPRTWTDGELVTAAIMNAHVRDNLNHLNIQHKYKASDETVVNTTLQNDDDLVFAVAASERWFVDLTLLIDSNTAADFKSTFTVPASATMKWGYLSASAAHWLQDTTNTGAALVDAGASPVTAPNSPGAGTIWGLIIRGVVQVAGTAGNVQFQWAQNSASGSTVVKAGSLLIAHRVST